MPTEHLKETKCPVCKEVYHYVPRNKPATCGKFDCLYKKALKKLKIKEEEVAGK